MSKESPRIGIDAPLASDGIGFAPLEQPPKVMGTAYLLDKDKPEGYINGVGHTDKLDGEVAIMGGIPLGLWFDIKEADRLAGRFPKIGRQWIPSSACKRIVLLKDGGQ